KYGLPDDYLLFVGQISGRKNTERLVEAFALSGAGDGFTLVLAGSLGRQAEKTLEAIRRRHLEKKVEILGYVADSELPALYAGAKGFLFPTIYEGFGLPILEAMACGTPVLTSNVGSAPEVSGDRAILVDPYSVGEIARGMEALLRVPACRTDDARRYAQQFTWTRCAEQTLAVYERLLQG
ncbi:MAG TPA: glycosyltransferase family 1 protein, partial [Thermoanaerobaculia bacterium]|nr:glycosyltransferase family 1 protein [Thermoanaerobaculia bacterium]